MGYSYTASWYDKLIFMIDSIKNNGRGIGLMVFSALLASFGQMFWKMFHTEGLGVLILGFVLYAGGAVIMIIAYRYGKLSILQPMLCLSYVFAIFIAAFILNEEMTPIKIVGIIVVIFGVIMIAGGDEAAEPKEDLST